MGDKGEPVSMNLYGITEELLAGVVRQQNPDVADIDVLTPYDPVANNKAVIKARMVELLGSTLSLAGYGQDTLDHLPEFIADAIDQVKPHPLSSEHIRSVADQITEAIMSLNGKL